jgi:hypothetical protein
MARTEGDAPGPVPSRKLVLSREILDQLERLSIAVGEPADPGVVYSMSCETSTGDDIACKQNGCNGTDDCWP